MTRSLSLTNDIAQIPILAEWINLVGKELQLSDAMIFQLNLALEEAVVNVMNYAYPNMRNMPVLLRVETLDVNNDNNCIVFILTDEGVPFDPTKEIMPDVTLSAEERPIGGLGIFLIEQLMESVTYERVEGRNILTMKYRIK